VVRDRGRAFRPHRRSVSLIFAYALAMTIRIQLVHVWSLASRTTCLAICPRMTDEAMASENAGSHSTRPDVMM
jgi:hypothetical protein